MWFNCQLHQSKTHESQDIITQARRVKELLPVYYCICTTEIAEWSWQSTCTIGTHNKFCTSYIQMHGICTRHVSLTVHISYLCIEYESFEFIRNWYIKPKNQETNNKQTYTCKGNNNQGSWYSTKILNSMHSQLNTEIHVLLSTSLLNKCIWLTTK